MKHSNRRPIPGRCHDIDGESWHQDGTVCEDCGFGIDVYEKAGDGLGHWGEPIMGELRCIPNGLRNNFLIRDKKGLGEVLVTGLTREGVKRWVMNFQKMSKQSAGPT